MLVYPVRCDRPPEGTGELQQDSRSHWEASRASLKTLVGTGRHSGRARAHWGALVDVHRL